VDKSFFFPKKGKVNIRFKKRSPKKINNDASYILRYTLSLIERDFGFIPPFSGSLWEPHHNIDAYLKSDYEACAKHYNKEFIEVLSHRFREKNDVQRCIVSLYSFYKNHANLLFGGLSRKEAVKTVQSWTFPNNRTTTQQYHQVLDKYQPILFCVNDEQDSSEENRKQAKQFLESRFPDKSSFEK